MLEGLDYRELVMHGQAARRTVRHFGYDYDYEGWRIEEGDPLPSELEWLRERAAGLVGREADELAQILITRYPPGAGIGWHRDAPMFGPEVIGVSAGAPARMRFQRGKGEERRVFDLTLEPRSAYVIGGESRTTWQHSIPASDGLRYSVTFRTLKERG